MRCALQALLRAGSHAHFSIYRDRVSQLGRTRNLPLYPIIEQRMDVWVTLGVC